MVWALLGFRSYPVSVPTTIVVLPILNIMLKASPMVTHTCNGRQQGIQRDPKASLLKLALHIVIDNLLAYNQNIQIENLIDQYSTMNQVSISVTNKGSSSQSHPQRFSTTDSISIESVESSIQTLIRRWYRRQKWKFLFNPTQPGDLNREPWRIHLANFLQSTPVHVISLALLITDLILTILELSSSLLVTRCRPKDDHKVMQEIWYHWVGISILTLLSTKTVALAVGLGSTFFRRPGYIIDGIVLVGALGLEVFLEKMGGGLLVVVSLWRVVRVVESAFELSDEAIESQIAGLEYEFEMLRDENRRLLETIAEKDQIIQKLQEDLDQYSSYSSCKRQNT